MFVDRVEIEIIAGKGGDGCMAFRREKHVPFGGPCGGDGGDGASVVIRAKSGVNSLVSFAHQRHWRADHGSPGLGSDCHGRSGKDLVLNVPPGTVLIDKETGLELRDLVNDGDEIVAARGGRGGWGNTHFKASTNQAPRETTSGGLGESRRLILELKSIADVGLIGMPNAGKSTMLSRLSRARPEIADYPFTTKFPNLGLVQSDMDRTFVLADIPGLIEGAAEGHGLGHDFLRHIMRAGILVHLVEPSPMDQTDPIGNYKTIRNELAHYSQELAQRPEIVVVTKAELPDAADIHAALSKELGRDDIHLVSAVTGSGLRQLVLRIADLLAEYRSATK
ncbi:MAG: GTPase ObgE [Planctomycetota bacterium]|jgi:GTP-binding protein|nr:GTPase ObgE [Planctomycetota bacterium]RLS72151.1 MAG: GTPase ObgE [Planctomycetota bacterium]